MHNKHYAVLSLLLVAPWALDGKTKEIPASSIITLESPVLELIDGVRFCIDGNAIKNIKTIIRRIGLIQYGFRNPKTGVTIGRYQLNGQSYTLHELVPIEKEYENRYAYLIQEDKKKYDAALQPIRTLLEKAKDDFGRIVEPFIDSVKGSKDLVIQLIEQFCQKRGHANSLLLGWGKSENNEREFFDKRVTSIEAMDIFCTDLREFLESLKASCPKGRQKYKELKRQQQPKHR